ncbi:MAG: chlorophyll synthesis pathway protein BchC [Betaproteobacteria bacterium]
MKASAIVFQNPRRLSVQSLDLRPLGPGQIEVEVDFSGISTGTERLLWDGSMPAFPGMGYPLVPGYETTGLVVGLHPEGNEGLSLGDRVFVPGSYSFEGVHNLFGGAGSRLIAASSRVVKVSTALERNATLLALAATAYHSVAMGGTREPAAPPALIVGHGIMGRLLARLTVASGATPPVVWETHPQRREGARGYCVVDPSDDERKDYPSIYDVSGDASIINQLIGRLKPGGEVVLAGFYKQDISFAYPQAFMREATLRVASEWKRADLLATTELVHNGTLCLDGLITHAQSPALAHEAYEQAFGDSACLKMILDWRH